MFKKNTKKPWFGQHFFSIICIYGNTYICLPSSLLYIYVPEINMKKYVKKINTGSLNNDL